MGTRRRKFENASLGYGICSACRDPVSLTGRQYPASNLHAAWHHKQTHRHLNSFNTVKSLCRLSAQTVHKGETKKTSVPLFDLSLMVNPVFLVFFLSLVCMNFGYPNIFVMLPSFCQVRDKGPDGRQSYLVNSGCWMPSVDRIQTLQMGSGWVGGYNECRFWS